MSDQSSDFEALYKAHYKQLRIAARNIIGDSDGAHDVVQEVFVKLWKRREQLHIILNIQAYLYRSVINTAITHLESQRKHTQLPEIALETTNTSENNMLAKELEKRIHLALNTLPPKCKAIFVLSRMEGMRNKDIAQHLSLSLKTVENQMGIALKKLKDELKNYLAEGKEEDFN
jgi:RNA polymerase sigma-70 factor (ECF subfamily)